MQTPEPPFNTAPGPHPASINNEVLAELKDAHILIALLLQHLPSDARARFADASHATGLGTEGATRQHQRAAVIARAGRGCTPC